MHAPPEMDKPLRATEHGAVRVVVLAGGRSSRFGRDKAKEPVFGVASLARVVAAAGAVVGDAHVVVHDQPAGGPLGAVLEAWAEAPEADLIVLACDLPLVTPAFIASLALPMDGAQAWVPRVDGRAQPLAARYARAARAALRAAWEAGERSINRALDRLVVRWIDDVDPRVLADFDTPEDLGRIARQGA